MSEKEDVCDEQIAAFFVLLNIYLPIIAPRILSSFPSAHLSRRLSRPSQLLTPPSSSCRRPPVHPRPPQRPRRTTEHESPPIRLRPCRFRQQPIVLTGPEPAQPDITAQIFVSARTEAHLDHLRPPTGNPNLSAVDPTPSPVHLIPSTVDPLPTTIRTI